MCAHLALCGASIHQFLYLRASFDREVTLIYAADDDDDFISSAALTYTRAAKNLLSVLLYSKHV